MGVTFIAKEGTYTAPATLTTKSITENGTYSAVDDSVNGYSSVTVNVPLPTGKITITENGTDIDVTQYAKADVNVAGGGGSSDFSTGEVTLSGTASHGNFYMPVLLNGPSGTALFPVVGEPGSYTVVVYTNGTVMRYIGTDTLTLSGDIQSLGGDMYLITGDCTVTVS